MILLKRIGLFLIGFSMSLILVSIIFKKNKIEFCYWPNCRVLKRLRSYPIVFTPQVRVQFSSDSFAKKQIKQILTYGNIDFSKSHPRNKPCKQYFIDFEHQSLDVKICDTTLYAKKLIKK